MGMCAGTFFPRLYAAASLKRYGISTGPCTRRLFPRLYAAASLKRNEARATGQVLSDFSAALCRGLIEAKGNHDYATARAFFFRGFMPRPH